MATRNELTLSIAPNEVLLPGTSITVEARSALDAQSAQGGIVVKDVRCAVDRPAAGVDVASGAAPERVRRPLTRA